MVWNGQRRTHERSALKAPTSQVRSRRRAWALVALVVTGLVVPLLAPPDAVAASVPVRQLTRAWSDTHAVRVFQESHDRLRYSGRWVRARHEDFDKGRAFASKQRGAKFSIRFSGSAVSWIGPVGPTRGKARVYINGKYVDTVNTYARSFKPSKVLFKRTWTTVKVRTLTVVVAGTKGHPMVAVDAIVVRGKAIASAPRATPAPTPAPTSSRATTTSGPIAVTTHDRVIDGVTISSSGTTGIGIKAFGTASNPIRNLTIRNCRIKGFHTAIEARHVRNLVVENCVIEDARYGGIMVYSGTGGRLEGNTIRRIGYGYDPGASSNNAYGIALSRAAVTDFTAQPRTTGFVVNGNLVEDVPLWHCFDTHAGQSITFSNNTARRCPRPFFITADAIRTAPRDIRVTSNRIETAVRVSSGTNPVAITLVSLQGGAVTGNAVSRSFPTPHVHDYQGNSSGVTISGNTSF